MHFFLFIFILHCFLLHFNNLKNLCLKYIFAYLLSHSVILINCFASNECIKFISTEYKFSSTLISFQALFNSVLDVLSLKNLNLVYFIFQI